MAHIACALRFSRARFHGRVARCRQPALPLQAGGRRGRSSGRSRGRGARAPCEAQRRAGQDLVRWWGRYDFNLGHRSREPQARTWEPCQGCVWAGCFVAQPVHCAVREGMRTASEGCAQRLTGVPPHCDTSASHYAVAGHSGRPACWGCLSFGPARPSAWQARTRTRRATPTAASPTTGTGTCRTGEWRSARHRRTVGALLAGRSTSGCVTDESMYDCSGRARRAQCCCSSCDTWHVLRPV